MRNDKSAAQNFGDINSAHYTALGGTREGVLELATDFYSKVFDDAILSPMFRDKKPYHAERLSWLLLSMMQVDPIYFRERGLAKLHQNHYKSMQYKERDSAPPGCGRKGGGFTNSQMKVWKGHFIASCERKGISGGLLQDFRNFVDRASGFYGPFENDRKP